MVQIHELARQLAADPETRDKWSEAAKNITDLTARAFKPSSVSETQQVLLTHKRKATVLNELEYQHAFLEKPKVRNTRQIPCKMIPSLTRIGEKEKVTVGVIIKGPLLIQRTMHSLMSP